MCKCKLNSFICNWNRKSNNDKLQCRGKKCCTFKKDYSWNSSTCIFENGKYLRIIVHNSKIVCDEIIYVMDIISANVTSAVSTNSDDKKVRYTLVCYILRTVLLVIILLFIIAIICYPYAKHKSKLKSVLSY